MWPEHTRGMGKISARVDRETEQNERYDERDARCKRAARHKRNARHKRGE